MSSSWLWLTIEHLHAAPQKCAVTWQAQACFCALPCRHDVYIILCLLTDVSSDLPKFSTCSRLM